MPISTLIDRDARCTQCRYNLRGLTLDDNCPECGTPVLRSVRYGVRVSEEVRQRRAVALEPIADATGSSLDAMEFVLDLLNLTTSETAREADVPQGTRHAAARDLCALIAD